MLFLLFLPSQEEGLSHSSPDPVWCLSHERQFFIPSFKMSPFHRLQFFINCPSVGPFPRVQSFRNTLIQCGSLKRSQVLLVNLLQCGLIASWTQGSLQESAPVQASHGITASFRHLHALAWGLPFTVGEYLLHCYPPLA